MTKPPSGWAAGLLVLGLAFCVATPSHASEVSGPARVIDGDTIAIETTRIRLEGIDSPETDQLCLDPSGHRWTCGIEARDRLRDKIAGRPVSCHVTATDRYQRGLGVCRTEKADLNAWMVRQGLALAYVQYSQAYVGQERAAKHEHLGLWAGAFIAPWDWRHRNKETVILGSLSVPPSAQTDLLAPSSAADAPSPTCAIKGNVNRSGERIFHMPGQRDYARVSMSRPEKRWFCSEEDAQAAGWRKAVR